MQMSKWIKKGDKVVVTSGNSKGLSGKVLTRKVDKVVVQGVNIRKKHVKRRSQEQTSEIVQMEMPIHISNVSLCDSSDRPVKVKVRWNQGIKELFYLDGDKDVVFRQVKKSK